MWAAAPRFRCGGSSRFDEAHGPGPGPGAGPASWSAHLLKLESPVFADDYFANSKYTPGKLSLKLFSFQIHKFGLQCETGARPGPPSAGYK